MTDLAGQPDVELLDDRDATDDESPLARRTDESPDHHALFIAWLRIPPRRRAPGVPWVDMVKELPTDLAWVTVKSIASRHEWRYRSAEQDALELREVRARTVDQMTRAAGQSATALNALSLTLARGAAHYATKAPDEISFSQLLQLAQVVTRATAAMMPTTEQVKLARLEDELASMPQGPSPLESPGLLHLERLASHPDAKVALRALAESHPDNAFDGVDDTVVSEGRPPSAADMLRP